MGKTIFFKDSHGQIAGYNFDDKAVCARVRTVREYEYGKFACNHKQLVLSKKMFKIETDKSNL